MKKTFFFFIITTYLGFSQNLSLNYDFINQNIRFNQLNGDLEMSHSFNLRPLNIEKINLDSNDYFLNSYSKNIISNKKNTLSIKLLPVSHIIEFNSRHPYNRNNGSLIPNKGYQHLFSMGLFLKAGPLSFQFMPEHHYSQNKAFDGFWEGHYPAIWKERYALWNHIDMPERFGEKRHNQKLIGQSNISLSWKNISLSLSNENLWWGPSIRNSIMLSNHARGFKHISIKTNAPIKTLIGSFEAQLINAHLKSSGYLPPNPDYEYAGRKLYVPKINQNGETDDWRFLQAFILNYSPSFIKGLSFGFIRWVQMYGSLREGRYWWMEGKVSTFPVFNNLLRKNDAFENIEAQTNQAAGVFLKWIWHDSKAEIYTEFYHNDSKQNFRDLLLDSDHSRAVTIGLQKIFKKNLLFSWEWTQMEQNASRLVRNAGSWYEHGWVYHGYTNFGEVLGSSIGPGSNSHYFSLKKYNNDVNIGVAFEIIDHDNDFFHQAFSSANDYRRYWKDFNFHLNYDLKKRKYMLSLNAVYIRSLNYQWELADGYEPYYRPGKDTNNFHTTLKFLYFFK